jgi:hypothetical protein
VFQTRVEEIDKVYLRLTRRRSGGQLKRIESWKLLSFLVCPIDVRAELSVHLTSAEVRSWSNIALC